MQTAKPYFKVLLINIIMFLVCSNMDVTPTAATVADEPFLGTLDIILLAALFGGGIWYLLKKRAKKDEQPERSYSIQ